ncbi:hypothetical protein PACTADRAFT_2139 [Pachysolen tannophilus NRRL Y-2460]|uniref:RING-type domain-containing protein n=1 Tax=Pachysolen tannophilus NRRL Y-2460 TaxID=669874 RepID=A0A1E4TVR4_PACTA|nr:hypothetical protein PACTADRAFT_2139 [Pachysolen tannophilus NRRL Y-2460]
MAIPFLLGSAYALPIFKTFEINGSEFSTNVPKPFIGSQNSYMKSNNNESMTGVLSLISKIKEKNIQNNNSDNKYKFATAITSGIFIPVFFAIVVITLWKEFIKRNNFNDNDDSLSQEDNNNWNDDNGSNSNNEFDTDTSCEMVEVQRDSEFSGKNLDAELQRKYPYKNLDLNEILEEENSLETLIKNNDLYSFILAQFRKYKLTFNGWVLLRLLDEENIRASSQFWNETHPVLRYHLEINVPKLTYVIIKEINKGKNFFNDQSYNIHNEYCDFITAKENRLLFARKYKHIFDQSSSCTKNQNSKKYLDEDLIISNMESTCAVCYTAFEEIESIRMLPCKHIFHSGCLHGWMVNCQGVCPTCRYRVDNFLMNLYSKFKDLASYFVKKSIEMQRLEIIFWRDVYDLVLENKQKEGTQQENFKDISNVDQRNKYIEMKL